MHLSTYHLRWRESIILPAGLGAVREPEGGVKELSRRIEQVKAAVGAR
jgi:hypothetical protein